jgi:hypothetical protein
MQTGLFRAVEILDEMIREVRETQSALAISVARMQAYRNNRAGEDADCRHADMLTLEAQALERAKIAMNEAAHSDPTNPGVTMLEVQLGRR